MLQENECVREKVRGRVQHMNWLTAADQGKLDRPQQRRSSTHEREVQACGITNQHRSGGRAVRGNTAAGGASRGAFLNSHRINTEDADGVNDISQAHTYATAMSDIFVELCDEDRNTQKTTAHVWVARQKSLYGMT